MKTLPVSIYSVEDDYGYFVNQSIQNTYEYDFPVSYFVSSLNECPEDATIERDLFDAYDYIDALNYGIRLAKAGYDIVQPVAVSSGIDNDLYSM